VIMIKRTLALTLSALCLSLSAGCATDGVRAEPTYEAASRNELVSTNYRAADALLSQLRNQQEVTGPTLGRLVSEQVAARFAQQGRAMVELKLRQAMYMRRSEGELALTREITEAARQHNAQAILLGSYGLSGDMVFINLKVVQPGSSLVLAAYDYALPLNREVRSLLGLPG